MRIAGAADLLPPAANAMDGEGCGIVVDPEVDPARIGGEIIDAVWHRATEFLDQEVMHPDPFGIARRPIFPTAILEVADQFLLLRIDRDHRLVLGQRRAHRCIDVLELRVPIRVAVALARLAIALQAETHAIKQVAHQRMAHLMTFCLKFMGQTPQALARPAQRRLRIAACARLNQCAKIAQQRRILHHGRLAAATHPPNPTRLRCLAKLPQPAANRTCGYSRCCRYRRDTAVARRCCLGCRNQPPTTFVQKRRDRRIPLPDRFDVNHPKKISASPRFENPASITQQSAIRLFFDGPLDKAIELNPEFAEAYNNRGLAYYRKSDYDRAIIDLNKAIEIKPQYAEAYNNRSVAYYGKGDYDGAIADASKAIEINSQYARAYSSRSAAYDSKGDYDRAIADASKAIEIKLQFADAYDNRSVAYYGKGDYDRAIADASKAIEIDPHDAEAYNDQSGSESAKGDCDNAIADASKAIEIRPQDAEAYNNRGFGYDCSSDYDRVITDLDKAIEISPRYAVAYHNRGRAYNHKGDYDDAIANADKMIEINPQDIEAYNGRSVAYDGKGDYDRAIADASKAIEIEPGDALSYNNRGFAFNSKGDYKRGIADLDKAIEIDPEYATAYDNRGFAYDGLGDHDRAIADFSRAIEIKPQFADAYSLRGKAYEGKGEPGGSRCIGRGAAAASQRSRFLNDRRTLPLRQPAWKRFCRSGFQSGELLMSAVRRLHEVQHPASHSSSSPWCGANHEASRAAGRHLRRRLPL